MPGAETGLSDPEKFEIKDCAFMTEDRIISMHTNIFLIQAYYADKVGIFNLNYSLNFRFK